MARTYNLHRTYRSPVCAVAAGTRSAARKSAAAAQVQAPTGYRARLRAELELAAKAKTKGTAE